MKSKIDTLIIGAGCGGLGAACWLKHSNKEFIVIEGAKELPTNLHNGVHYLHSIPELPFPFVYKEITLTDGILHLNKMYNVPSLLFSLQYSEKVREIQHPSSIMDIGKRTKVYMPKSNSVNTLMQEMYEYAGKENFEFGWWLKSINVVNKTARFQKENSCVEIEYVNLISTIPLDKMRELISNEFLISLKLESAPVYITNFKVERIVPDWMINIYIPDPASPIYRASILNGICSVESMKELDGREIVNAKNTLNMFHFADEKETSFVWKTGKVISLSPDDRLKVFEELKRMNIYQVGRFGVWNRKLLIDSTINQSKEIVYNL